MEHEHLHSHSHFHAKAAGDLRCPVLTDVWVVKAEAERDGYVRDYLGERYYFCCGTCVADFDSDPAKYAH